MREDFFSAYLSYVKDTEVPVFFHRWAAIAGIGAFLGRNYYFKHGHFHVHPNIYCMFIGAVGTRKSTAIKMMKSLLTQVGYDNIAADKTTKEKFLLDLMGEDDDSTGNTTENILDRNIFGADNENPRECFIMADEFNDFFGNGNIEFISLLGTLWDFSGVYKSRIKNGKSVAIFNPTISILGGNTPTNFSTAFPPEIIGQGFFSRLLLIYGEPSGRRITFPTAPTEEQTSHILNLLVRIKNSCLGQATLSKEAEGLLHYIYQHEKPVDDVRFESYSSRRFQHLLKLCIIVSAAAYKNRIEEDDVVFANTILTHTEYLMPKALGEFGKAKHSDVAHKIIQILETAHTPIPMKKLWVKLHNDLENQKALADLLNNLIVADKIQAVSGGFLPNKKIVVEVSSSVLDYSYLTDEERSMSK